MSDRICTVAECERPAASRCMCTMHYFRWKRNGTTDIVAVRKPDHCQVGDCMKPVHGRGMCGAHWFRWNKHGHPLAGGPLRPRRGTVRCAIEDCDGIIEARGWCAKHYQRWRHNGHPLKLQADDRPTQCRLANCDKPRRGHHSLCGMHLHRWNRTRSFELRQREKLICSVTDCDAQAKWRGLCTKHVARLVRTGTVDLIPHPLAEIVSYRTLHARTERTRGKARDRDCVDCLRKAHEWSYDHTDPSPRFEAESGWIYSLDIYRYDPRCRSCHRKWDTGRTWRDYCDVPETVEG